jgi:hypothetical protein
MVRKYIQSALEEKLSTSDFGAAVKKQLLLLRLILLLRFAGVCCVCVGFFPQYTAAAASQSLLTAIKSKTELSLYLRAWLMG